MRVATRANSLLPSELANEVEDNAPAVTATRPSKRAMRIVVVEKRREDVGRLGIMSFRLLLEDVIPTLAGGVDLLNRSTPYQPELWARNFCLTKPGLRMNPARWPHPSRERKKNSASSFVCKGYQQSPGQKPCKWRTINDVYELGE